MNQGQAFTQAAFDSSYGVGVTGATVGAGKMSPEASDKFFDLVFDVTSMKKVASVEPMNAPQKRISRLNIGNQILKPGVSGTNPGTTANLNTTEVLLTAKELVAVAKINDDELEDNIEGRDLTDHFIRLIAMQVGNELESYFLNGIAANVTPVDGFGMFNGWLYQAQQGGHVIDGSQLADGASGANTRYYTRTKLSKGFKAIPSKYKTTQVDFRHFISPGFYEDYLNDLATRQTPGIDPQYLDGRGGLEPNLSVGPSSLGYSAIPLHRVALMPENQFVVAASSTLSTTLSANAAQNATSVTLTSVTNLAVGDALQIDGGSTIPETMIVGSISTNTVTFANSAALKYAHSSGATAVRGTADGTSILTTTPQNLVVGYLRDVRIEPTRWGPERATYLTVSLRVDTQVVNSDAMALVQNAKVA